MVQGRGCPGLALKALEGLTVVRHVFRKEFEGHEPGKRDVLCLVHHSHTPATEFLDDAIVRDGSCDHASGRNSRLPHVRVLRDGSQSSESSVLLFRNLGQVPLRRE
jgi:hypothetical protein